MKPIRLADIASALGINAEFNQWVNAVCTDSRKLTAGELFVALRGEHFDGHAYLEQVAAAGAVAAIVEREQPGLELPQLVVKDCYAALGLIGQLVRAKFSGPLIGITGSSGKTTVKEMLASILSQAGNTLSTRGNLNNHIGVPLTLMELGEEHDYAVIEMGASGPGEIAYLSALAKPSVVMVNNVMAAHLQGFGSLDGVAMAKGEIYRGLAEGAKAVINQDQDYAERWASGLSESQILRFSLNEAAADLYADQLQLQDDGCYQFQLHTPAGETQVQLSIPGRHNVANGLAAASCAFACGIGLDLIAAGLANADSASGRLQLKQHCSGATIIDDSYNANPGSVKAAIDMLAERDGEKFLVLGDMGELGEKARSHHADVGAYAQGKGLSGLFCVGELSKAAAAKSDCGKHFGDKTELVAALRPLLGKDTTVLVKGSRSAAMETVVAALLAEEQGEHNNNKAEPSC